MCVLNMICFCIANIAYCPEWPFGYGIDQDITLIIVGNGEINIL